MKTLKEYNNLFSEYNTDTTIENPYLCNTETYEEIYGIEKDTTTDIWEYEYVMSMSEEEGYEVEEEE